MDTEFEDWKTSEFEPIKKIVIELPCDVASRRVEDLNEKIDSQRDELSDVNLKVDAVMGSQYDDRNSRARQEGMLYVIVPLMIAILIFFIRNGIH